MSSRAWNICRQRLGTYNKFPTSKADIQPSQGMSSEPIVSHGRGGPVGDQGDGAFSTGRGGAANIGSPKINPTLKHPGDEDVIPETAVRPGDVQENYHTGRGGEGNVHVGHADGEEHVGLADKLKGKLGLGKKE
ncbi:Protein of unknown function DUF3602 [Lasallia pustulata]|uniref:Uncharacterized protein n=1 Tax=Lasallia pustulata TaxID=136370 RepID=A0A1W5DAJ3_9LECA|nr:Protein of unknown function DUF3602 [Lasallia pustulata]